MDEVGVVLNLINRICTEDNDITKWKSQLFLEQELVNAGKSDSLWLCSDLSTSYCCMNEIVVRTRSVSIVFSGKWNRKSNVC